MKLYATPRPERYEYGHGVDGQYIDISLPATFATSMVRQYYREMRRDGVRDSHARRVLWYSLWMGGLYGSRDDLHTPYLDKEIADAKAP